VFGNPNDSLDGDHLYMLPNGPFCIATFPVCNGTPPAVFDGVVETEISLEQHFNLSAGCSFFGLFCIPAERGVVHSIKIPYSDGTFDTLNFEWIVLTPEPASASLLITALCLVLAITALRRKNGRSTKSLARGAIKP
jgi:hypothetical protein